MGVGLSDRGIVDHGVMADKGVHKEVEGNNIRICSRETNIQNLYRRRSNGGFQ